LARYSPTCLQDHVMPRNANRHPRKLGRFTPRIKVWLETDGEYAFGHGVCEILQAVERTGSIKQAAVELGKSYRYIWGRIKEAEQSMGQPLVETHVGGKGTQRSFLTPIAGHLVTNFLAVRVRMNELVREEYDRRFRDVAGC
jgi:molybdate transport system regulatory protein